MNEEGRRVPSDPHASFEQSWEELVAEVEAAGPEAIAELERLRTAYRIGVDAELRGMTHVNLLLSVLRRSGMTVEDLRRLRDEWR